MYISLESPDKRLLAQSDPRSFLSDFGEKLIIDEIQRVPELFSYLQEIVDEDPTPSRFIITGSQQFMLMEGITQSLAGRIATFNLMPFSYRELIGDAPTEFLSTKIIKKNPNKLSFSDLALTGFYPRIHDRNLDPIKWYDEYINNYIEKDVRLLSQVANLDHFHLLLKLVAARTGQMINYASLSNDIGISLPTVKRWISILETSGIIFTLRPFYKNFGKRLVKTPKLFFIDTGVLCSLLSITNKTMLKTHPLYGNIFENFVISEIYKSILNKGLKPNIYFWRDQTGNEIDCLVEKGLDLFPIEIKSSKTFNATFKATIEKWFNLKENMSEEGAIIYDGDDIFSGKNSKIKISSWRNVL